MFGVSHGTLRSVNRRHARLLRNPRICHICSPKSFMKTSQFSMMETSQISEQSIKDLIRAPGELEWRYEMRRECQEIIPNLFLGPFAVSKSLETLKQLGITHIVCIRDSKEAFSVKPRFPDEFQYMVLDVQDTEDQNLIQIFPAAKKFIYDAIAKGGRVLVHCNGGISLSPSFVIMFVMEHHNLNHEDALHLVQNRRYCISPNTGFLTQIKEYESIYRARHAIASHSNLSTNGSSRRKRENDDDYEEEHQRAEERRRALQGLGQQQTSVNEMEDTDMSY